MITISFKNYDKLLAITINNIKIRFPERITENKTQPDSIDFECTVMQENGLIHRMYRVRFHFKDTLLTCFTIKVSCLILRIYNSLILIKSVIAGHKITYSYRNHKIINSPVTK